MQDTQPPPVVIILPADALEALKRPAVEPPPPALDLTLRTIAGASDPPELRAQSQTTTPADPPRVDLTVPTVFYVAAVSGAWAGASATCVEDDVCQTVTPVLPTVGSPMKALGWGLLIQGGALWAVHQWVAPHWPRVAQGILYGLSALHIASGTDHVLTSRRVSKAYGAPPP